MKTFRIVICEDGSLKNRNMEKVMCVCVYACVCVCVCVCVSPQEHTNVTSLQTYINHPVLRYCPCGRHGKSCRAANRENHKEVLTLNSYVLLESHEEFNY